jgi:hypothetical protein
MLTVPGFVSEHPIMFRLTVIAWWLVLAAIAHWSLGWRLFVYICLAVAALDAILLPARVWLGNRRRSTSPDGSSTG